MIKTPHGIVPFQSIVDPQAREAVMKLNENIMCLAKKAGEIKSAASGSVDPAAALTAIEEYLPQAQEAVSAISKTLEARDKAVASAKAASWDAAAAAKSAQTAKESEERAGESADLAGAMAWSTSFVLSQNLALDEAKHMYDMSAFVPDVSADYKVQATFVFTAQSSGVRYAFFFTKESGEEFDLSQDLATDDTKFALSGSYILIGTTVVREKTVKGSDIIAFVNGGTANAKTGQLASAGIAACSVFLKISKV